MDNRLTDSVHFASSPLHPPRLSQPSTIVFCLHAVILDPSPPYILYSEPEKSENVNDFMLALYDGLTYL